MFNHKLARLAFTFCALSALSCPLNALAEDSPTGKSINDDLALGRDINRQQAFRPDPDKGSSDLLGSTGGYIHPYISLTTKYSDNIYNTLTNEESDRSTITSPGIQLMFPGMKDMTGAVLATSNLSSGGLLSSREPVDYFKRFQTSVLYQADIENYADNPNSDTDHHRVEGLMQLNLKGGVSFDLAGEYKLSSDSISSNAPLDEYQSDLVDFLVTIEIGSKVKLDLGHSTFRLDYDTVANDDKDREDSTYSSRLSFDLTAKTSIFAEYQAITVDYDQQDFPDNDIENFNGGIKWDITSKSSGHLKIGKTARDHEDATIEDKDEVFYELQALHQFTPKTSLTITGTRRLTESTMVGTNYIVNNQGALTLRQQLSAKFVLNIDASLTRDTFDEPTFDGTVTKIREDKTILITPTFDYLMKDWFVVSFSYSLTEQDSNFDDSDFTSNTFLLRISAYI